MKLDEPELESCLIQSPTERREKLGESERHPTLPQISIMGGGLSEY
jgi:hypothetical protein